MQKVNVENYRCFREEQTARLAPLTLLVGENSTGKTSFLAMLRALWQVAVESRVPDFQEPPYDMGTFSEIAHNRVRGRATSFKASFERRINNVRGRRARPGDSVTFEVTFGRKDGVPYPTTRRLYDGQRSLEVAEDNVHIRVSERKSSAKLGIGRPSDDNELVPLRYVAMHLRRRDWSEDSGDPEQEKTKDSFSDVEMDRISELARSLDRRIFHREIAYPPFAGAPVRSTPKRTYDPTRPFQDPSGEYIPTLLVNISRRDQQEWERLKAALENFGKSSGLFDEISIELLGKTEGSPFQLHVRKSWAENLREGSETSSTLVMGSVKSSPS